MLELAVQYQIPLAALTCEVLLSMNNARIAKKNGSVNPMYGILPAVLFLIYHVGWWSGCVNSPQEIWLLYVIGTIASVAFLFGSAFVTTGCLRIKNDELCINQDNKIFKLLEKLPVNFHERSLCSISWAAAGAIFLFPIFASLAAICACVLSLVVCAWTFQNPIKYFLEVIKFETWPKTEMRRNSKGVWISPLPWITLVAGVYFSVSTFFIYVSTLLWLAGVLAGGLLMYFVFNYYADYLLSGWEKTPNNVKGDISRNNYDYYYAFNQMSQNKSLRSLYIWSVFWQVFRQKYCPKIRYCTSADMEADDGCD